MRANQLFIIFCAFCFGALVAIWAYALENQNTSSGTQTIGKALIGGPFTLTDNAGKTKSDKDFRGKYMLIYFGYTYCPDVCPTDLQKMARALELVGKEKSGKIQPLFITIDPERDTPQQMTSYIKNFAPNLIGLTGTLDQIEKVKKAYKIYGTKVDENGKPAKDIKGTDYLMDHSPQTFLMDKKGEFIRYFRFSTTAPQMADAITRHVK